MISFFKNLLKPKEETVRFSELDKWLDNNNTELRDIKGNLKELERIKFEIIENLKALDNVDVSQAKVEDRVKHFVKGNLPAYINAISLFLKRIVPPEEINYAGLTGFCEDFEKEFVELNRRTFRNFQIIRELVGEELENVAKSVKELELLVKKIKKSSEKIKEITDAKEKADSIRQVIENKEKNIQRKQELQKESEDLKNLCKKAKENIERLRTSEKAEQLEESKKDEKKVIDKIKELENRLVNLFSPLQKSLKKYNNMCFVKKVDSYIENPVETLLKDPEMEILKFLGDVKKMVEENKIDLKDDKKKKTIESLSQLSRDFLKSFIEEYSSLKKQLSSAQVKITSNTVLKEISSLEKDFNNYNFKIENIDKEIEKIKDVDIAAEIKELEKKLGVIFSYKIRIENVVG